jgi:hypothetical protein
MEVESYLRRRYEGQIADVVKVEKEDLDLVRSPLPWQKQGAPECLVFRYRTFRPIRRT